MNVSRFYPKFPLLYSNEFDPYLGTNFNDAIVSKKEFASEKLNQIEPVPKNPGEYLRHQRYISRYMAVYDNLLLFHEPGTGKTCTAVASIENLRNSTDKTIKGAIICAKGEGLTKNFLQELMFTCTDGRYIPENYNNLTEQQQSTRLRKSASKFYRFKTFETFAKEISNSSDAKLIERYNDTVFVLDEVHNLSSAGMANVDDETGEQQQLTTTKTSKRVSNIYSEFHRLFHVLTRRKVILMSGTPIKDTPEEFAYLMNLMLPKQNQLATKTFVKDYFNADGSQLVNRRVLAESIKGYVSYLNSATTSVAKVFVGSPMGKLKHFIVFKSDMSEFQTNSYNRAYEEDKSIYISSRQASLFVFPDGTYGPTGYRNYIENKKALVAFQTNIKAGGLMLLNRYSCKYSQLLSIILPGSGNLPLKHFVYCQYVTGSGAIVLCKILEAFGYKQASGNEKTKGLRFALCTRHTANSRQVQQLINRFNASDNIDGEYISVIVGSRVLNEGFTLKDVRNEFIFTGHWNYAEVAQAIARGWRLGSHDLLLQRGDRNVRVNVYQCVSVPMIIPKMPKYPSIDMELYETAEKKDVTNRQIERLVKETAFDCALAVNRNMVTGYDGQRECDYQSCNYSCNGTISSVLDNSTFNLLSDVKEIAKTKIYEFLSNVFNNRTDIVDIKQIEEHFNGYYDIDAISEAISSLIDTATVFYNFLGFPNFLRIYGTSLFLSIDPPSSPPMFSMFYTKQNVIETNISFNQLFSQLYEQSLPALVTQLFETPDQMRELIVELPFRVQRIILEACILSREILGKSNQYDPTRNSILTFYQGFYGQRRNKWTVWLYADTIGSTCFDSTIQSFVPCVLDNTERTVTLKKSPVGWYGLVNPITNDFCIRDVGAKELEKDNGSGIDLRKLTVGKRCVNNEKSVLTNLLASRMKVGGDETYWRSKNKKELCEEIKTWFEEHNLIESNFDCGTSKKSRSKFI